MAAFAGRQPPAELVDRLASAPPAGVTLFRAQNVESVAQLRALSEALQQAAPAAARPLLIATDQEGGQLVALGALTTQFAGAMALGATGDEALAERVARATGLELRALGVNVNYAPVCDLATNPANPGLGIRSFGDDPRAVSTMAAATVRGLQSAGVAATAKHFPGKGDAAVDTHHRLAVVRRSRDELLEREVVPFRAALRAGARLVMAGHFATPGLGADASTPGTLSRPVMTDLLRAELGFDGVAITDALDMKALAQGAAQIVEVIAALRAGADLLLTAGDVAAHEPLLAGLRQAALRGLLDGTALAASAARVQALRDWLDGFADLPLEVVGCAEHRALAAELARRSITLLRDDGGLLPLRPAADDLIGVVMPRPADLTPADTSSFALPALAEALRARHPRTEEVVTAPSPTDDDAVAALALARRSDLLVLGTISASLDARQAALARALLAEGRPTVTVALRTPWDLAAYQQARTHLCSYGLLPPTLAALAAALFGDAPVEGRLPVVLGTLYQRGHGVAR